MLGVGEIRRWVDRFATPELQVRRDHLISHVLHQLPRFGEDVIFFGGTALCRTHLPNWRLSEDLDLLVDDMPGVARALDEGLARTLRRDFPGLTLRWTHEGPTRVGIVSADGLDVRVQLVRRDSSYRCYPVERTSVMLRYEGLPDGVELNCPTRDGAAAMKLTAWSERAVARDLCDLFGLTQAGALTRKAVEVSAEAAWPVQPHDFDDRRVPSEAAWSAALGHQMAAPPARLHAISRVRTTVADLLGWDRG